MLVLLKPHCFQICPPQNPEIYLVLVITPPYITLSILTDIQDVGDHRESIRNSHEEIPAPTQEIPTAMNISGLEPLMVQGLKI